MIVGKVYTGGDFNTLLGKTELYKLTNETELHNGYQFVDGLNIDTIKFDPTEECKKGGIYITTLDNIGKWIKYNHTLMVNYRKVQIPNDALVYIENNKFKVDKLILYKKYVLKNKQKRFVK